jgi:hypothetical protein
MLRTQGRHWDREVLEFIRKASEGAKDDGKLE